MTVVAEQKKLSAAEVQRILATEEWDYADVKAIEIKPAKLSKTISAFANTAGGEIFIGIAESKIGAKKTRVWAGFQDIEAANAHLQVIETMGKLPNHYNATFLSSGGKRGVVLHLVIQKTTAILSATDGVPYVRKGAHLASSLN